MLQSCQHIGSTSSTLPNPHIRPKQPMPSPMCMDTSPCACLHTGARRCRMSLRSTARASSLRRKRRRRKYARPYTSLPPRRHTCPCAGLCACLYTCVYTYLPAFALDFREFFDSSLCAVYMHTRHVRTRACCTSTPIIMHMPMPRARLAC